LKILQSSPKNAQYLQPISKRANKVLEIKDSNLRNLKAQVRCENQAKNSEIDSECSFTPNINYRSKKIKRGVSDLLNWRINTNKKIQQGHMDEIQF
jgi:hypothetical protein